MLQRIDRYELIERIGVGGQATVYLGKDTLLQRTVAVKVMNQFVAAVPAYIEAIMDEARLAAGLPPFPGPLPLMCAGPLSPRPSRTAGGGPGPETPPGPWQAG